MVTRNVRLTLELTERGDAAVVRPPVRILFLAANPRDTGRLSLELEFRELRDALQRSRLADRVELHAEWAVRVGDIQDHLLTYRPTIVHFSGHGVRAPGAALTPGSRDFLPPARSDPLPAVGEVPGGIVVWGDRGEAVEIAADALVELFRQLEGTTRCVVLNACYSEAQAAALAERVDAVIGMSRAVSDQTAIEFSRALYRAIAHGQSLASAFALA
ncbi:MAG: CHAT domain-containing protein, partial [Myxococcales bacterium]|nr:CHAT domain-containing protein [Myxococcales bacterium]